MEKTNIIPRMIARHQAAQRILEKKLIINPYGHLLSYPSNLMRTRRDTDRFVDLIAAVCFLRQYQKKVKTAQDHDGGIYEFIECDLEDYRIVYGILTRGVLSATLNELTQADRLLYEGLRQMARKLAKEKQLTIEEISFTQREIREATGYGKSWIKEHLRSLVDFEYVELVKGGYRGGRYRYRLLADEAIRELKLKELLTPSELEAKVDIF